MNTQTARKRKWELQGTTFYYKDDKSRSFTVRFQALDTVVKGEILKILQKKLIANKSIRSIGSMALPLEPVIGESTIRAEDMIRLKYRYGNRKLLRIKDPNKVLVQGYGLKAIEERES